MKDKEFPVIPAIWIKDYIVPDSSKNNLHHQPQNITEGIVICGWRHGSIIQLINMFTGKNLWKFDTIQGFVTNKNNFVDRKEAHKMHIDIGKAAMSKFELYSEDLY